MADSERPKPKQLIISADEPALLTFEDERDEPIRLNVVYFFPDDNSMAIDFSENVAFLRILEGEIIDDDPDAIEETETRKEEVAREVVEEYEVETGKRVGLEIMRVTDKLPLGALSGACYMDEICREQEYLGIEYSRWSILYNP